MGQGRSKQISGSRVVKSARDIVNSSTFVFDLVEFWIAGVVGLAVFGSIVVTVVHGGMPWECEEHVTLVSGAANLGFHMNQTWGTLTAGPDSLAKIASHYECEYMSSTAAFRGTDEGMCAGCEPEGKEAVCNAHAKSLGCEWFAKDAIVSTSDTADPTRNFKLCSVNGDLLNPTAGKFTATEGCCLYKPPTKDDQMHDVCYSIDQYVQNEHYPNFVGKYKDQVKNARTYAILGYAFGFAAFAARVVYHVPLLSNMVGGADYQASRDYWVRLADLVFLIVAFIMIILTFTQLDDVLMDNRKHLWGESGIFKEKSHRDAIEEQLVAGTGFYALAVYATLLGINVVWFLGTQTGIIPNHPTHQQSDGGVELRGVAFRSEHA